MACKDKRAQIIRMHEAPHVCIVTKWHSSSIPLLPWIGPTALFEFGICYIICFGQGYFPRSDEPRLTLPFPLPSPRRSRSEHHLVIIDDPITSDNNLRVYTITVIQQAATITHWREVDSTLAFCPVWHAPGIAMRRDTTWSSCHQSSMTFCS